MKSLTRTIIVLVIINLTIEDFALAQNAAEEPVRPRLSRRGVSKPTKPEPIGEALPPALPAPTSVEPIPPEASSPGIVTISGRTGLSGVEIQGLPGNPVTDENGFFSTTVPYGFSGTVRPVKKGYTFEPASINFRKITTNQQHYFTVKRLGPIPMFPRTSSRKVLVIPATDIGAENLLSITEDLQVMSHIFDEKFKEPQEIQGVFVDFGDFFGRDNRSTEAIYIQNYGVLFLMEVNFAFTTAPEAKEEQAGETEDVDPIWQRARRKMFSPPGFGKGTFVPEEQYSVEQIDQIKTELVRTLKHAANIRNLQPDECIILTVIGKARQIPELPDYMRGGVMGRSSSGSSGRSRGSSRGSYGGGMMGGMSGGMGGGMRMGGTYNDDGYGEMYGGGGFGGGMMMGGGMYGGMGAMYSEDYSRGSAPTTVLTIRVKKSDVDAFASGDLDFERFQKKVEIFTY